MLNDGTYEGMTKDLFDQVAKEIGAEPVYQDIPWTAELPGLEVKKFDIVIAPVTITTERMKHYAFTLPIADATVALMKGADDKAHDQAGGHRGQDRRGSKGDRAVQAAQGVRRQARRRRASRNMSTTTSPMPISPPAASTPRSIRCRISPTPSRAFRRFRDGDARRSACRPIFPGWPARMPNAIARRSTRRCSKMTDDGRIKAIQKKWFGQAIPICPADGARAVDSP